MRADQDPDMYEKLLAEAGPANEGMGPGGYGASIVMERMAKLPDYSYQWCHTPFIVW